MKIKVHVFKINKDEAKDKVRTIKGKFGNITHNGGRTEIIDEMEVHEHG